MRDERNGAEILVTLLEREGVRLVSGIPGGANLPLYDALRGSRIAHVLARHEQGAGFIAQGQARATGRAGVCLVSSGPGATNLLTAIADAKLDSVPLVAITGQVPVAMIGTDAFQEVDTYGLTLPITKHSYALRDAKELFKVIPEAFAIAESGRPGPVVVDVPKDVQQGTALIPLGGWPTAGRRPAVPQADPGDLATLVRAIDRARRPVLLAGGGVIASGASGALRALSARASLPVACTLAGLGSVSPSDSLALGMIGMHGARATNLLLEEADLLVSLGARFDDRATGRASEFCRQARIAHVDIDRAELGKLIPTDLPIHGCVRGVLEALAESVAPRPRRALRQRIECLRAADAPTPIRSLGAPQPWIDALARALPPLSVLTTDVGQHQMWIAQRFPVQEPRGLVSSGGLGTMGFGLPAAIGVALARPEVRVACVTGDGSLLMNLQELATLADWDLDVHIVLFNNRHLGLVRQQQALFYGERFHATRFESAPDFAAIARGFGLRALDLHCAADPLDAFSEVLARRGPSLIDIPIESQEMVLPMVPPGSPNREMLEVGPSPTRRSIPTSATLRE